MKQKKVIVDDLTIDDFDISAFRLYDNETLFVEVTHRGTGYQSCLFFDAETLQVQLPDNDTGLFGEWTIWNEVPVFVTRTKHGERELGYYEVDAIVYDIVSTTLRISEYDLQTTKEGVEVEA